MPKGRRGEKRGADVIANAVRVMRIATGEEEETPESPPVRDRGSDFSQISAEEPLRKIRRKLSEGDAEITHVFLADAVDGPTGLIRSAGTRHRK